MPESPELPRWGQRSPGCKGRVTWEVPEARRRLVTPGETAAGAGGEAEKRGPDTLIAQLCSFTPLAFIVCFCQSCPTLISAIGPRLRSFIQSFNKYVLAAL